MQWIGSAKCPTYFFGPSYPYCSIDRHSKDESGLKCQEISVGVFIMQDHGEVLTVLDDCRI